MSRQPQRPPRQVLEAWGGRRQALVHLVDWPAGRSEGRALCGDLLIDRVLFGQGTAARSRVEVCRRCGHRLEGRRRQLAKTDDLAAARQRRLA